MTVAYLTDVEGQWQKVVTFCEGNPLVRLAGDRLELSEGTTFVFGGDAIDRGPYGRRIVACLSDAKERYGERVVLIAGNRDLNKLRLRHELGGHPHPHAPDEVARDPVALLKWTLARTMGAPDAFEHHRAELGGASDEAVLDSYLRDLEPSGALTRYLRQCTLAYRSGPTLFVHGGVGEESLCTVPSRDGTRTVPELDTWIEALDEWYASQLAAYDATEIERDGTPGWQPLIEYQRPAPGKRGNPRSVVYSCLADQHNNPFLPAAPVVDRLRELGIARLVAGHTPSGDTPSVLRDPHRRFELILADNNYSRVDAASRVAIDDDAVSVDGVTVLDDGRSLRVSFELRAGEPTPVGLRTDGGPLVKSPLGHHEFLTLRYLPRYELQQRAVSESALGALVAPYAPGSRSG